MNTNMLSTALALPDPDLLACLPVLAARERTAIAELVAHLAALRLRPSLYAALGYGTLFAYCRGVLRLSEDAAANRIHAAKACLKFPVILELLASGELSLSAVRMLRQHLTAENHQRVLARARDARRVDIERLIAELAPRPDVATSVRKLPASRVVGLVTAAAGEDAVASPVGQAELPALLVGASSPGPAAGADSMLRQSSLLDQSSPAATFGSDSTEGPIVTDELTSGASRAAGTPGPVSAEWPQGARSLAVSRAVVQPLSPERYRVQFTMGQESHDLLRRLQTLLRREIPDGDAGAIFERALRVLHEKVEAARFGKTGARETTAKAAREKSVSRETAGKAPRVAPFVGLASSVESTPAPKPTAGSHANEIGGDASGIRAGSHADGIRAGSYANRIRPGADGGGSGSRYIPKAVKRAVWFRDRLQCAFVSASGVRCGEEEFLELHHIHPYALRGPATVSNMALRCRRHNIYEAELVFGPRVISAQPSGG